jgi:hypothetical protein
VLDESIFKAYTSAAVAGSEHAAEAPNGDGVVDPFNT